MARPLKNNVDYFPHDRDMRDHRKVKALRSKFGIKGYAVWSMLLEYLCGNDSNVFEYSEIEFELMSGDFGISATEIKEIIDYCIKLEMLFLQNGFVNSESLDERLLPVYEKRGKAKQLSKKQQRMNGKFVRNNTDQTEVSVTETPQSKVKETKEEETKKSIEERKKEFYNSLLPFVDEFGKVMIREFFDYWSEHGEKDRKFRMEKEKAFDVYKRLVRWKQKSISFVSKETPKVYTKPKLFN